MGKLFKFIGWNIGIVVVLFGVAAVAIPIFVDPNDYKEEIAELAKKHTGRELTIEGDIKLSVFPWVAVALGKVQVANAEGFEPASFAGIDRADVRVKLMPLLSKKVEMDTVTLHGLNLNLARNNESRTNWDDLLAAAGDDAGVAADVAESLAEEAKSAPKPADGSGDAGLPLRDLAVGGLDIVDAQINWNDAAAGQQITVSDLDVKTGEIKLGQPFPLDVAVVAAARG